MAGSHKEHMTVFVIFTIILTVVSYFVSFKLYQSMQDPGLLSIFIFAGTFMNTIILVVLAGFLLKVYEHIFK